MCAIAAIRHRSQDRCVEVERTTQKSDFFLSGAARLPLSLTKTNQGLLKHPPIPDQFVQPMMSFSDWRNSKGSADTALLWWEVKAQRVLWSRAADQGSPAPPPINQCSATAHVDRAALLKRQVYGEICKPPLLHLPTVSKVTPGGLSSSFHYIDVGRPWLNLLWISVAAFIFKKLKPSNSAQNKRSEFIHFIFAVNWTIPHRWRQDISATMDGKQERLLLLSEKKKFLKHHCNQHPKKVSIFRLSLQQQFYF